MKSVTRRQCRVLSFTYFDGLIFAFQTSLESAVYGEQSGDSSVDRWLYAGRSVAISDWMNEPTSGQVIAFVDVHKKGTSNRQILSVHWRHLISGDLTQCECLHDYIHSATATWITGNPTTRLVGEIKQVYAFIRYTISSQQDTLL